MLRNRGLLCALALTASGLANAQTPLPDGAVVTPGGAVVSPPASEARRISQLMGANVALRGTNNFGRVEDVVLNNDGGIGYLVVSNAGRQALLPWGAANVNYGQRVIRYDVEPQAIQPFYFNGTTLPNMYEPQYISRVNGVFPNSGFSRREVLRPVNNGAVLPEGTVVKEKVKVRPNGEVRVKDKVQ